jgi:hypothetical protein
MFCKHLMEWKEPRLMDISATRTKLIQLLYDAAYHESSSLLQCVRDYSM